MKTLCLFLFLFPALSFGQIKTDTIEILSGKVKIIAPKAFLAMSEQMWTLKYQKRTRPILVLTDDNGEVNLIADMTQQPAADNQLSSFKDFQIQQLKKGRPDMEIIDDGIKTIHGKNVGYFKFITQAIDQKVFNYYFFTTVDGKILLFTFNCIQRLQNKWEKTADEIVASIKIN